MRRLESVFSESAPLKNESRRGGRILGKKKLLVFVGTRYRPEFILVTETLYDIFRMVDGKKNTLAIAGELSKMHDLEPKQAQTLARKAVKKLLSFRLISMKAPRVRKKSP